MVGGTHYYTQSLLFHDALADKADLEPPKGGEIYPILEEPTEIILQKLKEVDPIMADRWHPNERRKIQRSLEIFLKTGRPASQIYQEQRQKRELSPGAMNGENSDAAVGLRFPTLVMWVHTNKDVLYSRLDSRVDKMLEKGLLEEVQGLTVFRQEYETQTGAPVDQTRGIWVSIGYKEFLDYQHALTQPTQLTPALEQLRKAAIERTQAATRQYANRQIKWIRIKLLHALIAAGQQKNIFLMDSSDISKWDNDVVQPSVDIVERFLSERDLPDPSSLSPAALEMLTPKREYDLGQRPDLWQKKTCEVCGTVAVTENDWTLHIKSRAHRRATGVKKKQENTQQKTKKDREKFQTDMIDVFESYTSQLSDGEDKT